VRRERSTAGRGGRGDRIDWGQLRALFAAGIKLDLRTSRSAQGRTKLPPLVIALVVYSFMGTLLATALVGQRDPFVYSLFTISAAMFMTGLVVIMEYGTAVVSPDDFQIIAHRPVSSKTYFWAKVGNLFFFVAATAGAMTLPAAMIGGISVGGLSFAPAYAVSALASCVTMAGFAVLVYAVALRIWSYDKFTSAVTYVHTAATFVLVLGYIFLPRVLEGDVSLLAVERGGWVYAAPPAWFAGAVELATGGGGSQSVALALMALAATVALVAAASGTISLEYSRKLSELAASSGKAEAADEARRSIGFSRFGLALCRTDAERAGFELMSAYMRRDKKLRARVLPAFGLPLAAYIAGLLTGELADPLAAGGSGVGLQQILGFYSMFVGFFFASGMVQSDQWKASWIFYAAPLENRDELATGARKLVISRFLVPFFVILFALMSLAMPASSAAAFVIVVFLLALITFALLSLTSPQLPLSQAIEKTRQARQIGLIVILGAFIGVLVAIQQVMRAGPAAGIAVIGALVGAAATTEWLLRKRLRRRLALQEYPG
jgi:ABC-2 type transport system permease protein